MQRLHFLATLLWAGFCAASTSAAATQPSKAPTRPTGSKAPTHATPAPARAPAASGPWESPTATSLGGKVFPVYPSPDTYNLTVVNAATDWNMAVQWVVRDSNSSVLAPRVFALTHIAMWRALLKNAKTKPPANDTAVAGYAAHLVLSNAYPTYYYRYDDLLRRQIQGLTEEQRSAAKAVSINTTLALLRNRLNDGTQQWFDYQPPRATKPGQYSPLRLPAASRLTYASAGTIQWTFARPFVLPFPISMWLEAHPVPPPPQIPSAAYDYDYTLIKALGSANSSMRNASQSNAAWVWSNPFQGTVGVGGQWMRVALSSLPRRLSLHKTALLLAAISAAQFDASVLAYNQKYRWNFWRPATAIRSGDPVHPPDPAWLPYVVSRDNPSYPSEVAEISGASAEMLRLFYEEWDHCEAAFRLGTDVALPYPDVTPIRSYEGPYDALFEASKSRIYTGSDFPSSISEGLREGQEVAQFIFKNLTKLNTLAV